MAETQRTTAIVLKRYDWRDYDSRVVLYTRDFGKKVLVARGTKRPGSKLAAHIEPLNQVELMILNGKQFSYVGSAVIETSFLKIKNNLNALYYAGSALAIFDSLVKENLSEEVVFNFLLTHLKKLEEQADNLSSSQGNFWYQHFISRLLSLLGYQPNLQHCGHCGSLLEAGGNYFSSHNCSIVCQACQTEGQKISLVPISDNLIKTLRLAVGTNELNFLKIPEKTLKEWDLINRLMIEFI